MNTAAPVTEQDLAHARQREDSARLVLALESSQMPESAQHVVDLQNEVDRLREELLESSTAAYERGREDALRNPEEVGFHPEHGIEGVPDSWVEKSFCRIRFGGDAGDPGVGIPGWDGWILDDNQAGTVLADLLAAGKPAQGVTYRIVSEAKRRWWSNELGWVASTDFSSTFTATEREALNLPSLGVPDASWQIAGFLSDATPICVAPPAEETRYNDGTHTHAADCARRFIPSGECTCYVAELPLPPESGGGA